MARRFPQRAHRLTRERVAAHWDLLAPTARAAVSLYFARESARRPATYREIARALGVCESRAWGLVRNAFREILEMPEAAYAVVWSSPEERDARVPGDWDERSWYSLRVWVMRRLPHCGDRLSPDVLASRWHQLTERQRVALKIHFHVDESTGRRRTLAETGTLMGVSAPRAYQLMLDAALGLLSCPECSRRVHAHLPAPLAHLAEPAET